MALLAQPTARGIRPEKELVGGNDSAAWEFFLQQATTAPGTPHRPHTPRRPCNALHLHNDAAAAPTALQLPNCGTECYLADESRLA